NGVNNRCFNVSDAQSSGNPVLRLSAGDYTLTVSRDGDTTRGYQVTLFEPATPNSIAPGTPVSDTLNPANVTKAYQFTLATGGKYFFNYQSSSGLNNAWWRLIYTYNNMVFSTSLFTDKSPLFLSNAGTYTVLVEGY